MFVQTVFVWVGVFFFGWVVLPLEYSRRSVFGSFVVMKRRNYGTQITGWTPALVFNPVPVLCSGWHEFENRKRCRLVAPYCAIPRDYLSDTPLLRAMGFLVSQHGQLGAIPPPPFLSVSPLESMRSGGAIPPLKKGISAILARYPMKTRQMGAIPPSAILSRKGITRYGGVSRTGPLSPGVGKQGRGNHGSQNPARKPGLDWPASADFVSKEKPIQKFVSTPHRRYGEIADAVCAGAVSNTSYRTLRITQEGVLRVVGTEHLGGHSSASFVN